MIVACHQPNYLSWLGIFHKLKSADVFVVLDVVQFPRGTSFVNRNRIKTPNGQLWLTVPVKKKGLGLQSIYEVEIDNTHNWRKKHLWSLVHSYKRAPYFYDYIEYLEKIYENEWTKLIALNLELLNKISEWLGIGTKIICSQELFKETKETIPTGSDLIIQICKSLGAETYLSGAGGKKYIDIEKFKVQGIKVKYNSLVLKAYPQLWGDFIPNLSIIDLLFNCGKKGVERIFT
ncbi:MAG: WbqC family protein [Candidatus Stahlbacteria bacterium]|nr:WbqC family protein [Candidatus Stahlbacteria bacterium]